MNSNDDIYEKQILSEPWFNQSKYLNIDKLKGHVPSLKYFVQEDKALEQYCTEKVFKHVLMKKSLFESKNAKSLARAGVPCKYMREFLLKLFNVESSEESFKLKHQLVFKEIDPKFLGDFVPYFSGFKTQYESLPVDYLTEEGILALKEILWMLNSVIPTIEYSPVIIKLASLVLIFCSQAETYQIMRTLLEMNYNVNETFKIRWHVRFTFNDNLKIISSFCESFKEISSKSGKDSFDHFENITFPPERLFEDMMYGYMINYLNFEGIVRLLPFFMLEGVKSLYRLSYAVIKTIKTNLFQVKIPDDIIKVAREKSKEITDMNKLFNLAYAFKINRKNNKYDFQKMPDKDLFANKRNSYYLPNFSGKSTILIEKEIPKLWMILPNFLRIKDAKMIFNTENNGYSLNTIYSHALNYEGEQTTLWLMETLTGEVFGGIMTTMFKHTNLKFSRPMQSFLLTVRPEIVLYEANKSNDNILYCDSECFMYGNGADGPAIRIDNNLSQGYSYANNAFGGPKLVEDENGEFKLKKMEIYILG